MTETLLQGDCLSVLATLPDQSVQCCVTSPPYYGLRNYGVDGQIGLEPTPDVYVAKLVAVFREVRRVLRDDGVLWLNLGDSYVSNPGDRAKVGGFQGNASPERIAAESSMSMNKHTSGLKPKDLIGIPWMVAFALRADGWFLRQDIIWHKPNPMPESVKDRCTKAHEYIFLLAKSQKYYYDAEAVSEPVSPNSIERAKYGLDTDRPSAGVAGFHTEKMGDRFVKENGTRNRRSVWTVTTKPFKGAHFATFPPDLIEPCILAGSAAGDTVLDPFNGAGTTGLVALKHGRKYIGIELNADYIEMTRARLASVQVEMI